jgi:ABC-type nitrate/sulfonate/bicarbonate transport system ATPase subunit
MLSVEALTCSFGGVIAVSRVSFSVQRGELFGLIGPNGAGKTTLFNLITGLSAPTAGRLRYQGRDITGLRPHRIAGLGIARTFQNVRLFGELSALQNVMIARHVRTTSGLVGGVIGLPSARAEERETRRRALALLELVGLADRPDERARNFAYGDQRRLELERPGAGAGAAPARRARRRHEQRREAEPRRAHPWHSHTPRPHHPLDRASRAARHGPLRSHRGAELRRAHRAGRARERPA